MSDAKVDELDPNAPVTGMDYPMQLEYHEKICPVVLRYSEALLEGKLIGHKCPKCGLVYAPPRGYCPICVIETTDADEIELADRGVITSYTVVTPVEYHGQEKTERFAKASVMLDGGGMLNLQDILEISVDDVHAGLRVEAVWVDKGERDVSEIGNRSWGGADGAIRGWHPTGEPDVPAEQLADKIY